MSILTTSTVTIPISGIEIVALKKLSLVSHALAQKLGGPAALEQTTLANTLDDVVRRIEIEASK